MHRIIIKLKSVYMPLLIMLGLILMSYSNDPAVHLTVIWCEVIFASALVRFDITHPYCWFSVIFALYATAYTICYVFGYDRSAGYSPMNSVYCMLAMGVVLTIVGSEKIDKDIPFDSYKSINTVMNDSFYLLFAVLSVVAAVVLGMRGYAGKTEMFEAGDIFYRIGIVITRWMIVLMIIQMCDYECSIKRKNIKYIVVSMAASLMMGLFTGERDIIFRAIVMLAVIMFYYKIIKPWHLLFLVPLGIGIMIISVYTKYMFLRGSGNTFFLESGNWLYLFLSSDFLPAGRNTQFLLDNEWTKGCFGLSIFFTELLRGLVPGVEFINPSTWYNYEVFPGVFKRQAFTFIGFGHIIGGIWGVILVFAVLGIFIRVVYHRSRKNIYTLSYYLFSISIVMGCFRQTINSVINISLKSALPVLLLSMILSGITTGKKESGR